MKKRALAIFEDRRYLSPSAWSILADFYPIRASYSYLLRLHRQGLLERRRHARGLILYRLSERGRFRLSWLARQALGMKIDTGPEKSGPVP
jgi:hypothetical protein